MEYYCGIFFTKYLALCMHITDNSNDIWILRFLNDVYIYFLKFSVVFDFLLIKPLQP